MDESTDKVPPKVQGGNRSGSSEATATFPAMTSTTGASVVESRDAKRRKRCPARHNPSSHTRVSISEDCSPGSNKGGGTCQHVSDSEKTGIDIIFGPEVRHVEGSQVDACAHAASSPPALDGGTHDVSGANLFSDISESVLSDPQIQQLLEDPSGLEDLFNDAELSWLVDPLTHHINARLAEGRGESLPPSPTKPARAHNRVDVSGDPAAGKDGLVEGEGGSIEGRGGSRLAGPGARAMSPPGSAGMVPSSHHASPDKDIRERGQAHGAEKVAADATGAAVSASAERVSRACLSWRARGAGARWEERRDEKSREEKGVSGFVRGGGSCCISRCATP